LFVFEDKAGVVNSFKGVIQSSKRYKENIYNGQWIEPDTYQVVVGYELHRSLNGIARFQ
jgi:lipoprotein-releasing system permease protein